MRLVGWLSLGLVASTGCDATIAQSVDRQIDVERTPGAGGDSDCPVCPAGYTPVGTECVWYGGPRNGDFLSTEHWDMVGEVAIDPAAAGIGGPGAAYFLEQALCEGGSLSQSFELPTFACSEPLALTVSAAADCEFCGTWLDIDINGGRHRRQAQPFEAIHVCLGERAYGQTARLALSTPSLNCTGSKELMVDDVDVWPALDREPPAMQGETAAVVCAPPGTIVNGDFEEGMPGWELLSDSAQIGTGFGQGGSRGLRLAPEGCEYTAARATASLPMRENTPSPAIELWAHGTGGASLAMAYGDNPMGVVANTLSQTARLCIPRWAQGVSEPILFALSTPPDCLERGSEYRIDQLAVVSDPVCDDAAGVFDGSFEELGTRLASSWTRSRQAVPSTDHAHDGKTSLMLTLGSLCQEAIATQILTIPAGASRPSVRLWYRTEGIGASAHPRVQDEVLPPSEGVWTEHVICLDATPADTPYRLELAIGGLPTCPSTSGAVYFDAIEVVADTARPCP